ncbi:hypothetical protein [Actinomadura sp. 9N407]|uniref:hypothetical protein n=1 Tax=Actinomadura sp. 9N407 TaxID=3375154 RepID=UPI0037BE19A3
MTWVRAVPADLSFLGGSGEPGTEPGRLNRMGPTMAEETPAKKSSGCLLVLITGFLMAVISIYGLLAADEMRVYFQGDSTTARVEACSGGRKPRCTGTWIQPDGTAASGPVLGAGRSTIGTSIEVRVLGGTATTSGAGDVWFKVIAMAAAMIGIMWGFVFTWRRRS